MVVRLGTALVGGVDRLDDSAARAGGNHYALGVQQNQAVVVEGEAIPNLCVL